MSKRILITGASRGIGRVCAELLARSGYRVVLASRTIEKLEEAASEIKGGGGHALAVAMDFPAVLLMDFVQA